MKRKTFGFSAIISIILALFLVGCDISIDLGDITAPGPITNLTHTVNGTSVTFTWTNPTDSDFKDIVIWWDDDNHTSHFTGNSYTFDDLSVGPHQFIFYTYDTTGNTASEAPVVEDIIITGSTTPVNPETPTIPGLTSLSLSLSGEGVSGDGTAESPYVFYNDIQPTVAITSVPANIDLPNDILSKVTWMKLHLTLEQNKVTQVDAGQTAQLKATYGTYESNTIYIESGNKFDTVVFDLQPGADFTFARDIDSYTMEENSENEITLKPVYLNNNGEEVTNPLVHGATWDTSANSIAMVDNTGKVSAGVAGTATVTYTVGGKTATIDIEVVDSLVLPVNFSFDDTLKTLKVNKTFDITPPQGINATIIYKAYDTASRGYNLEETAPVVSIDGSRVTTINKGDAYIFATWYVPEETPPVKYSDNYIKVSVKDPATSFTLEPEVEVAYGETYQIVPEVNGAYDNIAFAKADGGAASISVSNTGLVSSTTNSPAEAEITVTIDELQAKTIKVKYCVPVTSIVATRPIIVMAKNDTADIFDKINYEIYPDTATFNTDGTFSWESSNNEIFTVNENGQLEAIGTGNATIITKAGNKQVSTTVLVLPESYSIVDAADMEESPASSSFYADAYNVDTSKAIAYKASKNANNEVTAYGIYYWNTSDNDWRGLDYTSPTDAGWSYIIGNTTQPSTFVDGVASTDDDLELTLTPILVYEDETPYFLFAHALTNTSDTAKTNIKFGAYTDNTNFVNAAKTITFSDAGFKTITASSDRRFELKCLDHEAVLTPVSSVAACAYNQEEPGNRKVYTDARENLTSVRNTYAYSWQDIALDAGETKVFTVLMSFREVPMN